jgi:uncharacterized protein (TIGR00730 family)
MEINALCVYCGSSCGNGEQFVQAAEETGRAVAERGWTLVYGGGGVGLMGVLADAALSRGGRVVGVIPRALYTREVAHHGLTELHVVETMHHRKALMAELSDAFAALPGGIGTFEELFETLTWLQLGIHSKPIAVLNTAQFYDPMSAMLDKAVECGFLREQHRQLLSFETDVDTMLSQLTIRPPMPQHKWIDIDQV